MSDSQENKKVRHVWKKTSINMRRCPHCGMEKKVLYSDKGASIYYDPDGNVLMIGKNDIPPCVPKRTDQKQ